MEIVLEACLGLHFHYFPIFSAILLRFVTKVAYTLRVLEVHSRREGSIYGIRSSLDDCFVMGLDPP